MSPFLYDFGIEDDFRDRLATELERAAVRRKQPRVNWYRVAVYTACIAFCLAFWIGVIYVITRIA